ncbi:MAG: hypothetical protein ACYTFI_04770 [Planctomycetota bacterium]|jgi:hypothetical protein
MTETRSRTRETEATTMNATEDATKDVPSAHWRCVACRSENHVRVGPGDGPSSQASPRVGPVETACAHCRTRHILVPGTGALRRLAPLAEVGRRGMLRHTGGYRGGLAMLVLAASAAALFYAPTPAAGGAAILAGLGIVVLASLWLLLRHVPGSEGFRALEKGLEVRGADGRLRALIPWEKIHGAEYRLLMGRQMALWLAIEGADGTVPPAPLLAETGAALFTRSRAMPQFLLSLAGRLGERAPFLLPILTVDSAREKTGREGACEHGGLPLRSELVPELMKGALSDEALARSLAGPDRPCSGVVHSLT